MSYTPVIDRTKLYEGPAHILWDKPASPAEWKYCWSNGNVTVHLLRTAKEVPVSGLGNIDDPAADEIITAEFTPAGNTGGGLFDWMFGGILTRLPGQSIFDVEDTPVWIHALDGTLIEISNAKVTAFPAVQFGTGLARFSGACTVTGVIKKNTPRSAEGALFSVLAPVPFAHTPDKDDWTHLPCLATWNLSDPRAIMTNQDGWTLTMLHAVSPRVNPDVGTYDFRLDTVGVQAACTPINVSDVDLLSSAVIGSDRRLGVSSPAADLTLAEDVPGLTAILRNARLTSKPIVYGASTPRAGALTWQAFYGTSGLASIAPTT